MVVIQTVGIFLVWTVQRKHFLADTKTINRKMCVFAAVLGFMLSNIGMTSGVLGLQLVYCFIVLFKKVILSPLDLAVTMSRIDCDPVSRAVELDV